ncbi:MAG: hypothetical protein L0Z54_03745 [Thermoplasmata archaeon]|nr:hypothetical protein [Thermoplasmata archaeon]
MILDANALFLPFQFGINIDVELARLLGEYRYVVPASVADEVGRLRQDRVPFSREASTLLEHLSPEVVPGTGRADEDVVTAALAMEGYVFSLDGDVRRRALAAGVPVIRMRSKRYLVLEMPQRRAGGSR